MSRDTCRMPGCDHDPGTEGNPVAYNTRQFCSERCAVRFDHLKADAADARREPEPEPAPGREP